MSAQWDDLMRRLSEREADVIKRDEFIAKLLPTLSAMAARLDRYEGNQPTEMPERAEWFGDVSWSGPTSDYWANSGQINRELAKEISRLASEAQRRSERTYLFENRRNGGTEHAIEAPHRSQDAPQEPSDASPGPSG